jgi:hypothetical protein
MKLNGQPDLKKLTRLATCSALALALAAYAGDAKAVAYELDSGTPINILATANMLETVTENVTQNAHFGTVGVHQDPVAVATLTLSTAGVLTATSTNAALARIVIDTGGAQAPQGAIIAITGAFPTTNIYSTYTAPANLHCGGCSGLQPDFLLFDVTDDMGAPVPNNTLGPGTGVTSGDQQAAISGEELTSIGGAASFAIGAVIKTIPGAHYYESGVYTGNVNLTLSY